LPTGSHGGALVALALVASRVLTKTVLTTSVAPNAVAASALRVLRRMGDFMVCRLSLKCWLKNS
jgi:hypothetical protein